MQNTHDFSVRAIREKTASLPHTYTGKNCNVSLNSGDIVRTISVNGEAMLFSDMAITLCLSGEAISETNFVSNRIIPGTLELFSPGSLFQVKELIDKSVIAEIKIRLTSSDKSVAQIAEELCFSSSSLMCKFFKSHIGQSPMQYRKYILRHSI